ncbi:MAG: hypothetical protein M3P30_15670 [Chloroflexota bacterium]|nr:hypothetical protein [Chloroflexota bacterium]
MADLFIREDLSKPENRINVAIFGMMTVPAFYEWLLDRLGLPAGAVLYPPLNTANDAGAGRPDFAVRDAITDTLLAYIEVECHRDEEQIARFRRMFPSTNVLAVWGRPGPGCDLSLQEVATFLTAAADWHPAQIRLNALHLKKLIDDALSGCYVSTKKMSVGDEMWDSPFVQGLRSALGTRITRFLPGEGDVRPGEIRLDTTDTKDNKGFSLRVHSPWSSQNKSVSILNRSGGRPEIRFSSQAWLAYYLRNHMEPIGELAKFVRESGGDMEQDWRGGAVILGPRPKGNSTTPLRLVEAEQNVERIAALVAKLADRPASR